VVARAVAAERRTDDPTNFIHAGLSFARAVGRGGLHGGPCFGYRAVLVDQPGDAEPAIAAAFLTVDFQPRRLQQHVM
jgi:hypothetical protein